MNPFQVNFYLQLKDGFVKLIDFTKMLN